MALNHSALKQVRQRKYLARDFDSLRTVLLEYARLYYPDKIQDFSESSMGGILLDLAAYVGDNLSFYLDHQFSELNPDTAVESTNIERALRTVGVPIVGAAPAIVPITIFISLPAQNTNNTVIPRIDSIPIVKAGSIFSAENGTNFILLEDVDFSKTNSDGTLVAEVKKNQKLSDGTATTFIMAASGLAISGEEKTESITLDKTFTPFKRITLSNPNVSEIVSVYDGFGNTYYQVSALTHDVVYKNVLNTSKDNDLVKDSLKVIPAPYRYMTETNLSDRTTTLIFGGGSADTLEDDVIPDPAEFAISFPYSKTFSRIPVNPQQLLQTKTLGVVAVDTTLTITYRHGGGLNHNSPAGSVQNVVTLLMDFPGNPPAAIAGAIRGSVEVTNRINASGGEDAPDVDDLKALIPSIKNSQERIVTREDMLARVYTIPSNFGRVFRAAIRSNLNNPLATQLFIISRDPQSKLITSPDTLKQNLVKYLNPYRMISDAIDILDARVVNLSVMFEILVDPSLNRSIVLQSVLTKLQTFFDIRNFNIDQPIIVSDVNNVVYSVHGVISVNNLKFKNIVSSLNNRSYSDVSYDIDAATKHGIIFPPSGGIFEIRYPEVDIIGRATV